VNILAGAPCQPRARAEQVLVRRARPMMGTLVGVSARGDDPHHLECAIGEVFGEIARLEAILSEWRPDSAVSRINLAAGESPVHVPRELIEVIEVAGRVSQATAGAFDATWAPLGEIWKVDDPNFRPPTAEAVAAARKLVGYRNVVVDVRKQTVFLRRRGMRLGLGGIAKAYIAERVADFAVANGVSNVLVDAGGDIVARGRNGERPWTIGVRSPRSASTLLATIELRDETVATSGDYEHFVETDGRRYHHLLDPRTGFPASASRSATVFASRGALADALATGLFVLGNRGLDLLAKFHGTAAMVMDKHGAVHFSRGGTPRFEAGDQVLSRRHSSRV
jgi:thiamine biosynthesis lipoprotein